MSYKVYTGNLSVAGSQDAPGRPSKRRWRRPWSSYIRPPWLSSGRQRRSPVLSARRDMPTGRTQASLKRNDYKGCHRVQPEMLAAVLQLQLHHNVMSFIHCVTISGFHSPTSGGAHRFKAFWWVTSPWRKIALIAFDVAFKICRIRQGTSLRRPSLKERFPANTARSIYTSTK